MLYNRNAHHLNRQNYINSIKFDMGLKGFYIVQVNKYYILLKLSRQGGDLIALLRPFLTLGPMNVMF